MNTAWLVIKAVAPQIIWARYADAIGLDLMRETFGETWPPEHPRWGEEMWCWRDPAETYRAFDTKGHPAAWLALMVSQFDPRDIHMSRGVWPDQHGRGLGRAMRGFAEHWCRERGALTLNIEVNVANKQHLDQVRLDPYWEESGVLWDTPSVARAFLFDHQI